MRAWLRPLRTPDMQVDTLRFRYACERSRFIEVHGRELHVVDEGEGPAVLLIHGTASSLHTWDGWAASLRARHRVIRVDLPGFGLSGDDPDAALGAAHYVDVLLALLDRLEVARAHVGGNSLGGLVACHLAARAPERVSSLLLVCPGGFHRHAPGPFALTQLPIVGPILREVTLPVSTAVGLAWAYGNPLAVRREVIDRYHALLLHPGHRDALFESLSSHPHHEDTSRILAAVRAPTLILWGERDRFTRLAESARFVSALRDATLITYPELGHVPHEEAPRRTVRDVERFLESLAARV